MKFFLIGWICLGVGIDEKCVRMGSEVIHPSYELCNEYYTIVREEFSDIKDLQMSFTCVQAGLLEDLL